MKPRGKASPPGQGKSRSARRRRARRQQTGNLSLTGVSIGIPGPVREPGKAKGQYAKRYAAVLDDPFTNEPVKLGFGTLVDTKIGVARVTTNVTAGSDGSAVIIAVPSAQSPIRYNNVTVNTNPVTGSSWNIVSDGAWTTASAEFNSARPIALGLKITPIASANDKISRCVTGVIPYDFGDGDPAGILASLNAQTCATWFGSHLGTKTVISAGSSCIQTWRPMSLKNFQFDEAFFANQPAASTTAVFPTVGPVIFAAIAGPNAQVYDVELMYYYEALPNIATIFPGTDAITDGPSDYFPNLESFYKMASAYLSPENVGRAQAAASTVSSVWRSYSAVDRMIPFVSNLRFAGTTQSVPSDDDEEELPTELPFMKRSTGDTKSERKPLR